MLFHHLLVDFTAARCTRKSIVPSFPIKRRRGLRPRNGRDNKSPPVLVSSRRPCTGSSPHHLKDRAFNSFHNWGKIQARWDRNGGNWNGNQLKSRTKNSNLLMQYQIYDHYYFLMLILFTILTTFKITFDRKRSPHVICYFREVCRHKLIRFV